jgi:hypothetical protein
VRQAERREAALEARETRRTRCGCCGRVIELGEYFYTVARDGEAFALCRCCKDDVDESERIMEEDERYDV